MQPINIIEYFEKTALEYPYRIAVWDGETNITFLELRKRALAAAATIHKLLSGRHNQIVALFMPKSIEIIIVQLGVIYSGNAYMNIDIKNPQSRTEAILEQTKASLIVGDYTNTNCLVWQYEEIAPLDKQTEEYVIGLHQKLIDADPLCVINTSGSTGTPKSVIINHRSFIDFMEAVDYADIVGKNEIAGSLAPTVFDHFSCELCLMMARAFTLVLLPHSLAAFPSRMLELMQNRHVSFIFWVPSIMINIANMDLLSEIRLDELKTVWFAGEVFPAVKFNYWCAALPHTSFVHLYGPTETTVDCLYYKVSDQINEALPIPIGKPFRNTSVIILDENGQPAQHGHDGELCVRGQSLAMGYCGDAEKTASAFTQNPLNELWHERIYHTGDIVCLDENNNIIFKGRRDSMIKLHGYRIELGEIEHAVINTLPEIHNCCALHDQKNDRILLIYEANAHIAKKDIYNKLAKQIPRYMIPADYIYVESMPINQNGKLDRKILKKQFIK